MKEVVWSKPSKRDLAVLEPEAQRRIIEKFVFYAATGIGNVTKMQGTRDEWRFRDGDYRVIFERTSNMLIVKSVGNRREVYR